MVNEIVPTLTKRLKELEDSELKVEASVLLDKSRTTLIVPFVYEKKYEQLTEVLTSSGWKQSQTTKRRNVLEHINQLIPNDPATKTNGAVGKEFILEDDRRERYGLPANASNQIHLIMNEKKESRKYSFKIKKINLFLFETYVGFLSFDIEHLHKDVNSITLTNYYLKHLNHFCKGNILTQKEYHFTYQNPQESQKNDGGPFKTLSSITSDLLKTVEVKSYFSSLTDEPESALVYNAIMLDKGFAEEDCYEKKLGKCLFNFRRTFKNSYRPCPADLVLEDNPQVVRLFENSYWGISLEGLCNIVHLTNDSVTNGFFSSNYISNLQHSYFYLYIVALHQRYALLHLNSQAQNLPISENLNSQEFEEIQKLRKNINYFILRNFFKHVSSVTHQQKLYEMIEQCLQLESLKEDLRLELEALSSVAQLQQYHKLKEIEKEEQKRREQLKEEQSKEQQKQEKKEKDEQIKREKHMDVFLAYSTVFVVISAISSTWSILTDLLVKNQTPLWNIRADVTLGIISILFIIIGTLSYNTLKRKWKTTKK